MQVQKETNWIFGSEELDDVVLSQNSGVPILNQNYYKQYYNSYFGDPQKSTPSLQEPHIGSQALRLLERVNTEVRGTLVKVWGGFVHKLTSYPNSAQRKLSFAKVCRGHEEAR